MLATRNIIQSLHSLRNSNGNPEILIVNQNSRGVARSISLNNLCAEDGEMNPRHTILASLLSVVSPGGQYLERTGSITSFVQTRGLSSIIRESHS